MCKPQLQIPPSSMGLYAHAHQHIVMALDLLRQAGCPTGGPVLDLERAHGAINDLMTNTVYTVALDEPAMPVMPKRRRNA